MCGDRRGGTPARRLADVIRRLAGRGRGATAASGAARGCPACGHVIPAEAAQCAACGTFLVPWIREADGRWLESDGRGGWRPAPGARGGADDGGPNATR